MGQICQTKDFDKAWRKSRWGKIIDHSLINWRIFDLEFDPFRRVPKVPPQGQEVPPPFMNKNSRL